MSQMNLFLLGGAGANIGKQFVSQNGKKEEGFAHITTYFVDTSRSNLSKDIPEDNIYLFEGLDGSGKKRDSNYKSISESTHDILHRFKPADVNVIVGSCSGGSGSVISPILVSELLNRGEAVVALLIGSTGSKIETENTLKTLKSYDVISNKRDMPVVAFYRENSPEKTRSQVDKEIQTAIVMLAAIFSGDNRELDSSDLKNFLNYPKVTSYKPSLSQLDFFSGKVALNKGEVPYSLVSLIDNDTSADVDIPVEYQAAGFLSEAALKSMSFARPIHAIILGGVFHNVVDRLNQRLKYFEESRKAVIEKSISGNEDSTDEGLIL